jgi:hypothetical protein
MISVCKADNQNNFSYEQTLHNIFQNTNAHDTRTCASANEINVQKCKFIREKYNFYCTNFIKKEKN